MNEEPTKEIHDYMYGENRKKVEKYLTWLNYQMGFSGMGTTLLDIKPDFEMPDDLPEEVKKYLIEYGKEYAKFKWDCWCESAKDVDDFAIPENWKCPVIG
jgi:hypothetical protein